MSMMATADARFDDIHRAFVDKRVPHAFVPKQRPKDELWSILDKYDTMAGPISESRMRRAVPELARLLYHLVTEFGADSVERWIARRLQIMKYEGSLTLSELSDSDAALKSHQIACSKSCSCSGECQALILGRLHNLRKEEMDEVYFCMNRYCLDVTQRPGLPITLACHPVNFAESNQFWALLIGIDYDGQLSGSKDALRVSSFLQGTMHIPANHITLLQNNLATREGIISALNSLKTDDRIETNDNIFIYFAGHGVSYSASLMKEWSSVAQKGSVEALCPSDRGQIDSSGRMVYDISDREINVYLSELQAVKGSRITVVVDCCHSGGCTRDVNKPSFLPFEDVRSRSINPLQDDDSLHRMLEVGEAQGNRQGLLLTEEWLPNMSSHVLLAACRDDERAMERPNEGGVFTTALLSALVKCMSAFWQGRVLFSDIMQTIGTLDFQSPVLVGEQRNSPLWYSTTSDNI